MHLIIVIVKEENSELSKRRLRRVERRSLKRTGEREPGNGQRGAA